MAALENVREAAVPFNDAALAFGQAIALQPKKKLGESTKVKFWQILSETKLQQAVEMLQIPFPSFSTVQILLSHNVTSHAPTAF